MAKVTNCVLAFKWNDGSAETMWENLPEYLRIEITRYLDELVELRERDPQEYSLSSDTGSNHDYTPSWHTRSNGQPLDTEE